MTQTEHTLEQGTRERLMEAAGEVFAERGFRDATIRDICGRAGVNIAAVNYHFRDKEGLYRAVFANAARLALERYPVNAALPPDATVEDQFRAFIVNYLDRILNAGRPAWHGQLIAREMVEPTPVLDELVENFVRPQYLRLRSLMTELLGPAATEDRIRLCVTSVVGQCIFYKNCRPVIERLLPEHQYDDASRAQLAKHITAFSLHAIKGMREAAAGDNGAHP